MNQLCFVCLLALLAVSLSVTSASPRHVLSNMQPELHRLAKAHQQGSTSLAFSIAMKVHLAVKMLETELQIEHPTASSGLFEFQSMSCQEVLADTAEMSIQKNWVELYQLLNEHLDYLQQHCTNRDFSYGVQSDSDNKTNSLKGGQENKCAICTIVIQVMENYISYHSNDITTFVEREFCQLFDKVMRPTCQAFVHYAGPIIINSLTHKETADAVCLRLGFCKNPDCKIAERISTSLKFEQFSDPNPAPWEWLQHIFVDRFGNGHLPPFDLDNDSFSDVSSFRGYNWRGVDCDEFSDRIYPGRKTGSPLLDHDCNGIYGLNLKGNSFENQFCSEEHTRSKRLGVAVIGDSAGAHFSIPESYMNASMIGKGTYDDLLVRVANELDLPHYSGYTGHINRKSPTDNTHSVYKYLRNWNLCNHNDYQNIGVNGADSGNSWSDIKSLKRDQKNDYPLLMFLELIGNDVCVTSFNSMTKPDKFKSNILRLLNWLDETVPEGSHLIIFGLGDGDLLYDNLHNVTHPLNVTYSTVYDFMNCLNISPCWSWLNSNDTIRQFTTERAQNLSKVYQEIINDGTTFKNFDMVYYDFPAKEILERREMEGGSAKDMIESCDGFHPNGQFHSYLADWIWAKLQAEHSDWIGEKNPFNSQIRQVFGTKDIQ